MFELMYFLSSVFMALPRIVIPILWIFARWFLTDSIESWWWILVGFILAPFTFLLYCGMYQFNGGDWQTWQYIILGIIGLFEIVLSIKNGARGLGIGD